VEQRAVPSGLALTMTARSVGAPPAKAEAAPPDPRAGGWEQPTWHVGTDASRRTKATFTASTFAGFKGRSPCARAPGERGGREWDEEAVINIREGGTLEDVYFPSISKICSKGALCTNWACARAYWGAIRVGLKDDWHRISRRRAAKVPSDHICAGTGLAPATSAPGLGSPLPHLHQDWHLP
jgi:hypothetical protein